MDQSRRLDDPDDGPDRLPPAFQILTDFSQDRALLVMKRDAKEARA
jgi:hypothetical protein